MAVKIIDSNFFLHFLAKVLQEDGILVIFN